jgi:hypothetical protein
MKRDQLTFSHTRRKSYQKKYIQTRTPRHF